jgi:hypothetical protein
MDIVACGNQVRMAGFRTGDGGHAEGADESGNGCGGDDFLHVDSSLRCPGMGKPRIYRHRTSV